MEIYKDIKGYEGLYQISNYGNVMSLPRLKKGRGGSLYPIAQKIMSKNLNKCGYYCVSLLKNHVLKTYTVHRLVAQAFIPNPETLPIVNHKNEIKTDNRVENLEWCTVKYNTHYSRGWEKSLPKAYEVTSKPVLQFTKSGQFVAEYKSTSEAGRQTGIHHNQISRCCLGRKGFKSAGNYIWKYK